MDKFDKGIYAQILVLVIAVLAKLGFWAGVLYLAYQLIQNL